MGMKGKGEGGSCTLHSGCHTAINRPIISSASFCCCCLVVDMTQRVGNAKLSSLLFADTFPESLVDVWKFLQNQLNN